MKVDLDDFKQRLNQIADTADLTSYGHDTLRMALALTHEAQAARAVVEAAESLHKRQDVDDHWIRLGVRLAAYRAKVGGQNG